MIEAWTQMWVRITFGIHETMSKLERMNYMQNFDRPEPGVPPHTGIKQHIEDHARLVSGMVSNPKHNLGMLNEQASAFPIATDFLRNAADIMDERGKQYDSPEGERSMGKCVAAFNAITGHTLTEAEGWLLLQVLKDVRLFQRKTYHQDSAEDCVAYAALKAEAKAKEGV